MKSPLLRDPRFSVAAETGAIPNPATLPCRAAAAKNCNAPGANMAHSRPCHSAGFGYCFRMLKKCIWLPFLLCSVAAPAATVELKGKASITGTILAEKRDEIVIDIGYTVLVIPRNQVLKLLKDNEAKAAAMTAPASVKPASAPAQQEALLHIDLTDPSQ